MEDLKDVISLLDKYKQMNFGNEGIGNEIFILTQIKELLEWKNYTNEEKHEKRKFIYSVIKKIKNDEAFIIEDIIINLYELVENILEKEIIEIEGSDLKYRLESMLNVFIFHVNEQRDTRFMSKNSFKLIIDIANSCICNSDFLKIKGSLEKLISLVKKLQNLMP